MAGTDLGGFEKVLRVGEGRRVKRLAEQAAYITTLEPDFQKLSDDELRGEDGRVPAAAGERRAARGPPLRGVRRRARGAPARVGPAHVRRAADGRHRPPRGRHRRDEDRRGEDVRRQRAALPERARRHRRPPRHGQRLPGQARRRVEPRRLRAARDDGRRDREHAAVRRAQGRLRLRHHLRDELGVRLRLPPRQHGRLARAVRPARPRVRDRGRGRLDPRRRGADAADHLRRARDRRAGLRRLRARRPHARTAFPQPKAKPGGGAVEDEHPGRAPTSSTTRSSRRSRRSRPRSRRSSARCGSTTSTTRATSSSSTT